jgi:hypothetical protein
LRRFNPPGFSTLLHEAISALAIVFDPARDDLSAAGGWRLAAQFG